MTLSETTLAEAAPKRLDASPVHNSWRSWIGWAPLIAFPASVLALRAKLLPWVFMWLLAAAIFAGCKWLTWWQAFECGRVTGNWKRSAAYLLLWPGMDAQEFFDVGAEKQKISPSVWLSGITKTLGGIGLVWVGARVVSLDHPILGGWVGMVGLVLFLHFGTFQLITLAWQRAGVPVKPIMQRPLASRSLSELWGKRWNLGYRALSHTRVFQPVQRRFGVVAGTMAAFIASGLLHELVISVPAGAGYGLPTAYFLTQGLGTLAERSETGKRFGLGRGPRGWMWTAFVALAPVYFLFHPWFVMRVIVPFLTLLLDERR